MLKVIVDSTPILPKPSGVGLYVKNLISALHDLSLSEELDLAAAYQPTLREWASGRSTPRPAMPGARLNERINIPVRLSSLLWGALGRSSSLKDRVATSLDERFDRPDIIHGTNYAVPPSHKARTILNIYDLTFLHYPQYADAVAKTYGDRVRHCLQWTDLVMTVSESSKRDIIEYLQVEPERVWVTPLASQYQAHPDPNGLHQAASLRSPSQSDPDHPSRSSNAPLAYDFKRPFLLFVSTIEPRKNIINLIKGFNILKDFYGIDHDLILIGKKGWSYGPIFEAIERSPWRSHIHHLDYLPDEQVQEFYRHAQVFVYPSHYEGFGLPVLEAMTFGVPVVTANAASLPEVGGDAALYVDPQEPEEIAQQVFRILDDTDLQRELSTKGQQQAQRFSWEATAWETLRAYRSLA